MATPATTQTKDEARTTIRDFIGALNDHDVDKIVGFFTADGVWEGPDMGTRLVGREAIGEWMGEMFRAFPDVHYPLDDLEIFRELDGSAWLSFWTLHMTMRGTFAGFAPTDKRATARGACRYELTDGRISRHTVIFDEMDIVQQLGLMPAEDSVGYRVMAGMQRLAQPVARRLQRRTADS